MNFLHPLSQVLVFRPGLNIESFKHDPNARHPFGFL
jgi:hypothetical protein